MQDLARVLVFTSFKKQNLQTVRRKYVCCHAASSAGTHDYGVISGGQIYFRVISWNLYEHSENFRLEPIVCPYGIGTDVMKI